LIHRRRRLRALTDQDGGWHLNGFGNPESGAQVMAALGPIQEEIFHQARKEGRRESPDAYAFDSLVQLAVESTSEEDNDTLLRRRHSDSYTSPGTPKAYLIGHTGQDPEEDSASAIHEADALPQPTPRATDNGMGP
jgi:hypothetical protein